MNPIINAIMYIAVTVILAVGSFQVSSGSSSPGSIMVAITYTTQLLNGILGMTMLFQSISRGDASVGTHDQLLEQKGGYYQLYMTQYAGFAT